MSINVPELSGKELRDDMTDCTHTHSHTLTHTHTHTRTHSRYVILTAFPLPQCLHKRAPLLRYTYVACLVRANFSNTLIY